MRLIKFMAWQKHLKELFEVAAIQFASDTKPDFVVKKSPSGLNIETWTLDEVELLQFTGLTDKHGKDIYENYIVRLFDWKEVEQIMWCNNGFYVVPINSEDVKPQLIPHDYKGRATSLEIVGNIYENPEWDTFFRP